MNDRDWDALAVAVKSRRDELRMTQGDVQQAGGPSPAKLGELENRRADTLSPSKRRDLERALQWESGSIDAVLAGGDPTPAAQSIQGVSVSPKLTVDAKVNDPADTHLADDPASPVPDFLTVARMTWEHVTELADSPAGDPDREVKAARAIVTTADTLTDALLRLHVGPAGRPLIQEMGYRSHELMKDQIYAIQAAKNAAPDAEHQPSGVEERLADALAQQGVDVEHADLRRRAGVDVAVPFERSRVNLEVNDPAQRAAAAELLGSPLAFFSSDEFVEGLREIFTGLRAADPSLDLSEEMDVLLRGVEVQPDRDAARRDVLLHVMEVARERAVDLIVEAEHRGGVEAAEQWLNAASHAMVGAGARQRHSPSSPDDGEPGSTAEFDAATTGAAVAELEVDSGIDHPKQA